MKFLHKCAPLACKNNNIILRSFNKALDSNNISRLIKISLFSYSKLATEVNFNTKLINPLFNKIFFAKQNQSLNKIFQKSFSQQIKPLYKQEPKPNKNKPIQIKKKKRKSQVDKTLKKKDYTDQANAILNVYDNSPILKEQSVIEAKEQGNLKECFNSEIYLFEEIENSLKDGKLSEASLKILNIIELLIKQEKIISGKYGSDNKDLSIENNLIINNSTILKKLQIYLMTLVDIFNILEKTDETESHLKSVINLLEANSDKITDTDFYLLIKLKERLCTLYLEKDDDLYIEENFNEESEKLIKSNIDFLEKKLALPEIKQEENISTNLVKMLLENIHFFAIVLKKQNKFKESNDYLSKYLELNKRFPILSEYLINMEYSVHINLALNYYYLKELDNSLNYLKLSLNYLNNETEASFLESKLMIIEKVSDIYEELNDNEKLIESLEEKKRLTLLIIQMKTNLMKDLIEQEKSSKNNNEVTEEIKDENLITNNQNQNNNENKSDEINNNENNKNAELNNESNNEVASLINNPIFTNYENYVIKNDYLSLAKIYEDLIELIIETELQPEKLEEYISEAKKYYKLLEEEGEVFSANINFLIFIKNYDNAEYQTALEYGLKLLKIIESFEARLEKIINPLYFDQLNENEIDFFQIDENFYDLETEQQKIHLLKRFTNFDFYNFNTKFKIYFYLSKIYKALNNQEEKIKYQDYALKIYEEESNKINEKNEDDENDQTNNLKQISVLHLVDLLSIYENRKMSDKLNETFNEIVSKIKDGEIDFIKNEDKDFFSKIIYDVFFIKINYLLMEEKFLEAKEALKALDNYSKEDEDIDFPEEQKDNLSKTLNLVDLKIKYIQ